MSITVTVVSNTSLAGVVVSIVWLVLTGRLVPRAQIEDLVKDRDLWKEAYWRTQAVNDAQTEQLRALMKVADTTNSLLKSIPPAASAGEAEHETSV